MAFRKSWRKVFDKTVPNFFLRLFTMLFAQALIALAIGLSRATGLGTSTISCIPAVLSYLSPVTIGTWTLGMNLIFVVVQIVLLRRYFKPAQLLSIPLVAVFSAMIDFFVPLCELIPMPNYAASLAVSVLSCLVMALGGWIQAKCALIMVPGDGVVLAMSVAFRARYSTCKMALDLTLTAVGAVVSLATMGGLFGVREGTILAAFAVGPLIRVWDRLLKPLRWLVPVSGHITLTPERPDQARASEA